jgi:hypothetical protein
MLKCVQCLKRVAQQLQPGARVDVCDDCRSAAGAPRPMSYWLAYLDGQPEVLQVVEKGVQSFGKQETYPLAAVREWLLPIWAPGMAFCSGCCQAKPSKDFVFFFRKSPKGVCKECSEHFDFDPAARSDHA